MALCVRRSIPNRLFVLAFAVISLYIAVPLASAQHPYGHTAGVPAHVSSPPMYHAPVPLSPIYHTPISGPRISTFRSADIVGRANFFPPRRPIRPFQPVLFFFDFPFAFGNPFWGFNCWSASCDLFWPGMIDYNTFSSPGPVNYVEPVYAAPVLDYGYGYGEESADRPQLYLKDGSILNVKDYWLTDDQLHFTIVQEYGANPIEQMIPFEALDLQKTVDVNTRRGFRFILRNEPFEQYVQDHPEGAPPALTPQR